MNTTIETPRLTLIRLTDTSEDSQHLKWYHEYWSNDDIMAFSLRPKCHAIEESHAAMIRDIVEQGAMRYAVCLKESNTNSGIKSTTSNNSPAAAQSPGPFLGFINITNPAPSAQPTIMPPKSLSNATAVTTNDKDTGLATKESPSTALSSLNPQDNNPLNEQDATRLHFRFLSYAFFPQYHGNGYATEAARAVIDEYTQSFTREQEQSPRDQIFYLEACTTDGHIATLRVLQKLGFTRIGWAKQEKKLFIGGEWIDGFWVFGKYLL